MVFNYRFDNYVGVDDNRTVECFTSNLICNFKHNLIHTDSKYWYKNGAMVVN